MSRSRDNTDSEGTGIMKKFKFQMKSGHIYDGPFEITITNNIAEIEESDINTATLLVIKAHGGQEVKEEKPKPKAKPEKVRKLTNEEVK